MDKRNEGQWRVIRKVLAVAQAADIPVWLFGGWGLDARIGRITREHGDAGFWVERIHAERSKAMLVEAGAAALTTQPPEEACEFSWDDVPFSTAYFDRQSEILRGLVTGPGAGLTPGPFPAEDERKSLSQNERESRQ